MQAKFRLLPFCLALLIAGSVLPPKASAVDEVSDWFKVNPQISNQFDMGGESLPFSINGNRDCVKQKVVTRPEKVLPYWPYLQNEETHESCVVNTGYGAVSQSGYLQTAGETTFGRVTYPWGGSMTLLPVPRSANGIYIEPNPPNGVSLVLIRDLLSNIEGTTLATGEIVYTVKNGTSIIRLTGSGGQPLGVQLDSVSFSGSGKWMIADIPFLGLSRVDTTSFSVKTFDTAFNYNIGVAPGVQSAVTNIGRYVAVSSPSFTRFRLYDLEDCSSSTTCKYLDLQKYFKDNVSGFVSGVRLRFSTDYSLRMYMVQKIGSGNKVIRQTLRADGHPAVNFGYLGLGDSFASGEGAYQYKAITDTGLNKCHLSQRSYPYLIADDLGINEAESVACSGAILNDVRDMERRYPDNAQARGKSEPAFDKEIFEGFLPGYRAQIEFISELTPELLTISAVGNDIGFADKIKACLMPGTCYNTYEDRLEVALEVNAQFDRLVGMYGDIKEEMQGKKVYVIGYPEIAMDNGSCSGNVRLDAQEIKFSNQLVRHLNKMIKAAADKAGFFYVDVEQAFYGNRLCEASYPSEAINGITAGNDIVNLPFTDFGGPIGNESFHPNDLGHRKFKEVILNKTAGFTKPMPQPISTAKPPSITNSMELLKDMPKSGRNTKTVKYVSDLLESDTTFRGEEIEGSLTQTTSGFKPSSNVEVWLHSDPIKLGDYTTDTSGNLQFEGTVPEDIPFGFHTIHVYGTNITGKPMDIQKVIYVAEEPAPEPETPPAEEEDKVAFSNSDPKPPENNPETVAGDEEPVLATTTIEATQPQTQSETYAQTPFQAPLTSPQVAGATTTPSVTNEGQPQKVSQQTISTSALYLLLLLIPLAIVICLFHKQTQP